MSNIYDAMRRDLESVTAIRSRADADELRRLHAVNADLLEALRSALDASWNGPMPDYARDKACAAIARAEEVQP